jgi:hypothetical protein
LLTVQKEGQADQRHVLELEIWFEDAAQGLTELLPTDTLQAAGCFVGQNFESRFSYGGLTLVIKGQWHQFDAVLHGEDGDGSD